MDVVSLQLQIITRKTSQYVKPCDFILQYVHEFHNRITFSITDKQTKLGSMFVFSYDRTSFTLTVLRVM